MVHSQMVALEEPNVEDETDVIKIDVTNDKEVVEKESLAKVEAKLKQYEEFEKMQASAKTQS